MNQSKSCHGYQFSLSWAKRTIIKWSSSPLKELGRGQHGSAGDYYGMDSKGRVADLTDALNCLIEVRNSEAAYQVKVAKLFVVNRKIENKTTNIKILGNGKVSSKDVKLYYVMTSHNTCLQRDLC